jgi:hypothetical protein
MTKDQKVAISISVGDEVPIVQYDGTETKGYVKSIDGDVINITVPIQPESRTHNIEIDFSSGECGRCGAKLFDDNSTDCGCD